MGYTRCILCSHTWHVPCRCMEVHDTWIPECALCWSRLLVGLIVAATWYFFVGDVATLFELFFGLEEEEKKKDHHRSLLVCITVAGAFLLYGIRAYQDFAERRLYPEIHAWQEAVSRGKDPLPPPPPPPPPPSTQDERTKPRPKQKKKTTNQTKKAQPPQASLNTN